MEKLKQYIDNDVLEVKKINKNNVSKQTIYNFIKRNHMEKVGPGIYIMPNALEDEMYTLSLRCPNGVISHDDALYYYGLMNREPIKHTLTIYTGYKPTLLTNSGYKIYTIKKDLLYLGKSSVVNQFGHKVPMYDLERTICDLVRSRSNFEIQDYSFAIKSYAKRSDKDLNRLMTYAKALKADKKLQEYLEILL